MLPDKGMEWGLRHWLVLDEVLDHCTMVGGVYVWHNHLGGPHLRG